MNAPAPSAADPVRIDEASREAANAIAAEGAALAIRLGMSAVAGSASRTIKTGRAILFAKRGCLSRTRAARGSRSLVV